MTQRARRVEPRADELNTSESEQLANEEPRADQSCGGERTLRRGTARGHCSRAERGAGRARRVIYWGTPSCHTCHAMRMRMFTGNAMPCRATLCHAVLYHAMRMRMRHATLFYTTLFECGCAMFSGLFVLRNSRTSVLYGRFHGGGTRLRSSIFIRRERSGSRSVCNGCPAAGALYRKLPQPRCTLLKVIC